MPDVEAAVQAAETFDLIPFIPLIGVVAGALIAGFYTLRVRKRGEVRTLPPTWPEMWARLDAQDAAIKALESRTEKRDKAFANILRAAADQWPAGVPGPRFAKDDVDILEDTIPRIWLHPSRGGTPKTT